MSNVATQIKKGQVLNPTGRPKREWTWSGLLEQSMEEQDETGEPYKSIIIKKLRKLAMSGDIVAMKEILNRMDGMPKQDIETKGNVTMNVRLIRDEKKRIDDGNPV